MTHWAKANPQILKDMYAAMQGSKPTKSRLVKPPSEKGNRILTMAALTEMSMGLEVMQDALARLMEVLAQDEAPTPKEK